MYIQVALQPTSRLIQHAQHKHILPQCNELPLKTKEIYKHNNLRKIHRIMWSVKNCNLIFFRSRWFWQQQNTTAKTHEREWKRERERERETEYLTLKCDLKFHLLKVTNDLNIFEFILVCSTLTSNKNTWLSYNKF